MEPLDYWRLCDELTVFQAALLVVGYDPSTNSGDCEEWDMAKRPPGYEAAKAAVLYALRRGEIVGQITPIAKYD